MKSCIYNNQKSTIEVFDKKIILGKKSINYSDIYAIKKDNLGNYMILFSRNLLMFSFLSVSLLLYFIFGYVSTLLLLLTITALLLLVYWIERVYFAKLFGDDKFMIYDIVYESHHDTVLVSYNDNIVIDKNKTPKLSNKQHKFLQKYMRRIKQGRKYLIMQCESDSSSGDALYEKYKTVAGIRYKDQQMFTKQVVSHIETAINSHFAKFRKYTRYLLRANIILAIFMIYTFIKFWNMSSILFG